MHLDRRLLDRLFRSHLPQPRFPAGLRHVVLWAVLLCWTPFTALAQNVITGPTTITQPGLHVLVQDVSVPNCQRVITIDADHVTLNLNGFALRCPNGAVDSRVISIEDRAGIRIHGGMLEGGDYGIFYHAGERSMALDVRHIQARDFQTWALYVGGSETRRPLDGVILRDNHLSGPGRGLFLRRAGGQVRGNVVEGGLGFYLLDTNGLLVADNRIRVENHGMVISGATYSILRDNTIRALGGDGLRMFNASSNLLRDNLITASARGIGIDKDSHGNVMDWNHLGESLVGITVEAGATDNLLSNNRNIIGGPPAGVFGGLGHWHDAGGNAAH